MRWVSVIPAERSMNVFRRFKTTQTRADVHKQSRVYLLLIICDNIRVRTEHSGEGKKKNTPGLRLPDSPLMCCVHGWKVTQLILTPDPETSARKIQITFTENAQIAPEHLHSTSARIHGEQQDAASNNRFTPVLRGQVRLRTRVSFTKTSFRLQHHVAWLLSALQLLWRPLQNGMVLDYSCHCSLCHKPTVTLRFREIKHRFTDKEKGRSPFIFNRIVFD